jgi:WD40 repeat protein
MNGHTTAAVQLIQINANQVATVSLDSTMRVWDIATGNLVNTYNGHTGIVASLTVLPSGWLASGSFDGTIRVWNMQFQTVEVMTLPGKVNFLIFNPFIDKNGALVASVTNYLLYFDIDTLKQLHKVETNRTYVCMDVLLPSGNILAAGQYLGVYNKTGNLIFSYEAVNNFKSVKQLPDNTTVVLGFNIGSIALFNSNTNTFGSTYEAHTNIIYLLTLTPDLAFLLSGGTDNQLILWTWNTMSVSQVKKVPINAQVYSGVFISSAFKGKI